MRRAIRLAAKLVQEVERYKVKVDFEPRVRDEPCYARRRLT